MGTLHLPNRFMDAPVKPEHDGVWGSTSIPIRALAFAIPALLPISRTRTAVRDPRRAWRSSKSLRRSLELGAPIEGAGDARAS